jgi:hypothetical protein
MLNVLSRDNLTDKYTVVKNVLYNFSKCLIFLKKLLLLLLLINYLYWKYIGAEPNVFNETSIKLKKLIGKEVAPDEMPDRHPIKIMPEVKYIYYQTFCNFIFYHYNKLYLKKFLVGLFG